MQMTFRKQVYHYHLSKLIVIHVVFNIWKLIIIPNITLYCIFTECMAKKRQELQEELQRIEQRCLRVRGAKENEPDASQEDKEQKKRKDSETSEQEVKDDKGRKRNKFAMDVDEKERDDSDGEDRNGDPKSEDIVMKQEKGNV